MTPKPRLLRVYILDAIELSREDQPNVKPCSYLVVKVGDVMEKNIEKTLRIDDFDPEYYINFEIPIEIPGCPYLRIEVWNKNDVVHDTMIGYTEIDMEERYFNEEWAKTEKKPIEYRTLKRDSDGTACGRISLWTELIKPEKRIPEEKIAPIEKMDCELRVIVWEATDFVFHEKVNIS
jgi:hypothetical protein